MAKFPMRAHIQRLETNDIDMALVDRDTKYPWSCDHLELEISIQSSCWVGQWKGNLRSFQIIQAIILGLKSINDYFICSFCVTLYFITDRFFLVFLPRETIGILIKPAQPYLWLSSHIGTVRIWLKCVIRFWWLTWH